MFGPMFEVDLVFEAPPKQSALPTVSMTDLDGQVMRFTQCNCLHHSVSCLTEARGGRVPERQPDRGRSACANDELGFNWQSRVGSPLRHSRRADRANRDPARNQLAVLLARARTGSTWFVLLC